MREVVVLAGGDRPSDAQLRRWRDRLAQPVAVIAADGGGALADPLGLRCDALVGDLDSIDPQTLARFAEGGTRVERHPTAKDATDVVLALDDALRCTPERITVVGGGGGRADHELSLWLALAGARYADVVMRGWSSRCEVDVVQPDRTVTVRGGAGQLCSLLPLLGDAHGVWTRGLRFPLVGETLPAGTSRGVSNVLLGEEAQIGCAGGVLLCVRPEGQQRG